ncbi:uncharacterized protein LOC119768049 [Culex quinquefasciatus]|uniref:uncharacterized protein LOC119768049 n=1 Tax=Culex quinquefasciatus TaxID=7176 RepID=UPI0018E3CBCB|nr:uncharacterized protein LOC119768049 [Culex quinquefasciatus]
MYHSALFAWPPRIWRGSLCINLEGSINFKKTKNHMAHGEASKQAPSILAAANWTSSETALFPDPDFLPRTPGSVRDSESRTFYGYGSKKILVRVMRNAVDYKYVQSVDVYFN